MQRVLAKTLLSFSITPNIASNAYNAIGSAVNDRPHAIILDVVMPEIDGLQTLRLLKSMHVTRDIPVLVVTAAGDADSMGIALRLGTATGSSANRSPEPRSRRNSNRSFLTWSSGAKIILSPTSICCAKHPMIHPPPRPV